MKWEGSHLCNQQGHIRLGFFYLCRLHMERINSILFAQILDPYEVTQDEIAQVKDVLLAHRTRP